MTRKIIQIATASVDELVVLALCDDGSVWRRRAQSRDFPEGWYPLVSIPQDVLTGPYKPPSRGELPDA